MLEGIYIAYATGAEGYSAIMFVLRNGRITGADAGGMKYFGQYDQGASSLTGNLVAEIPPFGALISGHKAGAEPERFSMPFSIEFSQIGQGYIDIQSPYGKITANIQKLNELP
jgi:hypothetical protein